MPKLPGIAHRRAVNAFEKVGFWIAKEGLDDSLRRVAVAVGVGPGRHAGVQGGIR